jgi:hypothetical protein
VSVAEAPSDWLEPESEEAPAVEEVRAPSPPPRPVAPKPAAIANATPIPTAAAIAPPPLESEPPVETPRVETPVPAAREDAHVGGMQASLASEGPPPPPAPQAKPALPPPPETHEPESTSPTIAAAASSITIPEATQTPGIDEPFGSRRRSARVVIAGAALFGGALWIAFRATSPRPPSAQTANAKPSITAAVAETPQPPRSTPEAPRNPDIQPTPAPIDSAPAPVANSAPAPVANSAPLPTAEAVAPPATKTPAPPPENSAGTAADESRPAKKIATATTPPAPRATTPGPKADKPVETELPDPGATPARGAKSTVDDDALQTALSQAAQRAKGCYVEGGPKGTVRVSITFASSGDVTGASVQGAAFTNTVEGECIAAKFRALHIPAFTGADFVARKTVTIE